MTALLITHSITLSQLIAAPKEHPSYPTARRLPAALSVQTEREPALKRFVTATDFDHLIRHPMVQIAQNSLLFHEGINTERKAIPDQAQDEVDMAAHEAYVNFVPGAARAPMHREEPRIG